MLLRAYGAELVLTPGPEGMAGAIAKAEELAAGDPRYFIPQQFENPANPEIHRATTAEEIWRDTDGKVDIFVAGVGTGGTITGVGEVLKERKPSVQIVAVEPAASPVLSGGAEGPAPDPGHRRRLRPGDPRHQDLRRDHQRRERGRLRDRPPRWPREEGCSSASPRARRSGRRLQVAQRPENAGKLIVVIIPSFGERYLSHGAVRGPQRLSMLAAPCDADLASVAHERDPAARIDARDRALLPGRARRLGPPDQPLAVDAGDLKLARTGAVVSLARIAHRRRHPPRRHARPRALHRPRHRRGHRRDGRGRRRRDDLPRRHPRRHEPRARQAPPDLGDRVDDRRRRQGARGDHDRRRQPHRRQRRRREVGAPNSVVVGVPGQVIARSRPHTGQRPAGPRGGLHARPARCQPALLLERVDELEMVVEGHGHGHDIRPSEAGVWSGEDFSI